MTDNVDTFADERLEDNQDQILDERPDGMMVDFASKIEDKSRNIIKVVGVGGGGCNAVGNMYEQGIVNVTFAVCNTDAQALAKSPVPVKIPLGELGAGGDPNVGRLEAENHKEEIKHMLEDGTKMVFVTAGMGGGTGTGAAPIIAGIAKDMGLLTIGVVTIPFSFEKKSKIIKALKGVDEMRRNVDALLIINNERICDIYADSEMSVKESFRHADHILCDATKSISELITINGTINLDFRDVETTMRGGGGAIMAIGRAAGELRVEKAIIDALDSPLLYGNNISHAKRLLFNIYTSEKHPLLVKEMKEVDAFMDAINPDIEVINGISDDNSLDEAAKVTILATGFEDDFENARVPVDEKAQAEYYDRLIAKLYRPYKRKSWPIDTSRMDGERKEQRTISEVVAENEANAKDDSDNTKPAADNQPTPDDNSHTYDINDNNANAYGTSGNARTTSSQPAEKTQRRHHTSFLDRAKDILEKQIVTLMQD